VVLALILFSLLALGRASYAREHEMWAAYNREEIKANEDRPKGVGPSFNCAEAKLGSEKSICNNPALSCTDQEMTDLYDALLRRIPSGQVMVLRRAQKDWLKQRNIQCSGSTDIECQKAYDKRIMELKEFASANSIQLSDLDLKPQGVCRDSTYRFEFQYPQGMWLTKKFLNQSAGPSNPQGFRFSVLAVVYRPSGDDDDVYPDVEVRIIVSPPGKVKGSDTCLWGDADLIVEQSSETINGQKYRVGLFKEPGMNPYINGFEYMAFQNGYCFEIQRYIKESKDLGTAEEKQIAQSFYEKTDNIVKSFRFLGSEPKAAP
jgi:uncharacterized protein